MSRNRTIELRAHILDLLEQGGKSDAAIAREVGCSHSHVRKLRNPSSTERARGHAQMLVPGMATFLNLPVPK